MASMTRKAFLRSVFGAAAASSLAACQPAAPPAAGASSTAATAAAPTPPPRRTDKLLQRVFDQTISTYTIASVFIGDRLGLFRAREGAGPMTVSKLSDKTHLDPKYVGEWLRSMATTGYLDYRPAQQAFELPAEGPEGRPWSRADFVDLCAELAARPGWSLDELVDRLTALSPTGAFDDDCALILLTFP